AGDIYVLWGVSAGTPPEPIGTFDVVADGAGVRAVAPDANGFPVYAISLETGRVAPSTPSTVLASGPLEA
ncbi:MAG: hypothetical protein ACT4RN_21485, partial [Pseudonocardia sp.]